MKQIDIFGNEIEIVDEPPKICHINLKEQFRRKNGYLEGKQCENCKYHHRYDYHYKYYHKCEKLGITNSEATDIRLKDVACNLFEEVSEQ
jgi:hypothetical protein